MDGIQVKNKLREMNISVTEIAAAIGMSQQNLSAAFSRPNVRSGLLESIAQVTGRGMQMWYPELSENAVISYDNSQGGQINIGCTSSPSLEQECARLMKLLAESQKHNSELITIIQRLTSK